MSLTIGGAAALAAAISGAAGIAGQGVSAAKNKRLAKYQNELNVQNWEMQNAYNSPKAQMARLKEAGLNPNLVYGSSANTGNASTAPDAVVPPNPWSIGDIVRDGLNTGLSVLGSFQDIKKSNQEIEESRTRSQVNEAQARQIEQLILNAKQQGINMALDNAVKSFDLGEKRYLAPYQRKMAQQTLRKALLDYDKSRQEYDFYNSLNPLKLREAELHNSKLSLDLVPMRYRNSVIERNGYDPGLGFSQGLVATNLYSANDFQDKFQEFDEGFDTDVRSFIKDKWNKFKDGFKKFFSRLPKNPQLSPQY